MTAEGAFASFDAMSPRALCLALALAIILPARGDEKASPVQKLIPWLLDEADSLKGIPFSEVIAATSGKRVLPIDSQDKDDQRILETIGAVMNDVLIAMNAPDSKTRSAKRVNEMSSKFEDAIQARLAARPGFSCEFPKTAAGKHLRSGYPDLRLLDQATGRVFYLDPKLFAKGSKTSSFRTFYFEPKRETNKVNDDARHLIIGIEHERTTEGLVQFRRWELIDLSHFRVKLKAEFEGSNADMYRPEAVVGNGAAR
jgi:hypothetical protein